MKSKLTNRQKIAIRDAEENPQPKRGFRRHVQDYWMGEPVDCETYLRNLSNAR